MHTSYFRTLVFFVFVFSLHNSKIYSTFFILFYFYLFFLFFLFFILMQIESVHLQFHPVIRSTAAKHSTLKTEHLGDRVKDSTFLVISFSITLFFFFKYFFRRMNCNRMLILGYDKSRKSLKLSALKLCLRRVTPRKKSIFGLNWSTSWRTLISSSKRKRRKCQWPF